MSLQIEKLQAKSTNFDKVGDERMKISYSACLSTHKGTLLENQMRSGCLVLQESDERFLHHSLEIETYCGCITGIFLLIMVKAYKTEAFGQGNAGEAFFGW